MLAGRTAHDGEAGRGVPTFAVSSLDGARPLWIRIYEQSRAGELTDIKSARKRGCGRRRRPACRVSRRADRADRACVRRAAAAGFVARDALTYVNRRPAPAPNLIAR